MDEKINKGLLIFIIVATIFLLTICIGIFFVMVPVNRILPIPFTNDKLKTLDNIERIKIYGTSGNSTESSPLLKTIDNPNEVNNIVEKMRTYAGGWQYPGFNSYYFPRDPIKVYFYRNGEIDAIFVFGIGHQYGKPYIDTAYEGKYLSEEEFQSLIKMLGIDEALTYD